MGFDHEIEKVHIIDFSTMGPWERMIFGMDLWGLWVFGLGLCGRWVFGHGS